MTRRAAALIGDPRWPLLLFLLALLIRAGNMAFTAHSPVFWAPTSDEAEHWTLAQHLAGGDWLGRQWGPYHRPQLFAYALAVLIALFGVHFWIVHAFVGLCDSVAVVVWHAAARRAMGRGAAATAGVMLALYWPFVHFAGTGYMESFAMLLNAAMVFSLLEYARRVAWRRRRGARRMQADEHAAVGSAGVGPFDSPPGPLLAAAGVLAGLSLMTRPQILILLPAIAALIVRLHAAAGGAKRMWGRGLAAAAVFLILAAAAPALNAARHWALFGLWAPLGTGSELNFAMSNNADGWSWMTASPGVQYRAFQQIPFVEAGVPPDYQPTREYWARRNRDYLTRHLFDFLKGYAHKLLIVLNAYEVHCTQNFQLLRGISPLLRWLPGFGVLAPFGLLGLGAVVAGTLQRLRRSARSGLSAGGACAALDGNFSQRWSRVLLAVWAALYLIGVALFLAISRHRLPALPPLLLLGGWAMGRLVWLARRRPGRLGPWLLGLAATVVLVHLPVIPAHYAVHERWWSQVNVGVALLQLGDASEAEAAFRRAAAILPDKPEAWRQLSVALERQGRFLEAARERRHEVQLLERLYPRHHALLAEELEEAARLAAEGGDLAAAERDARRVVELVPQAARAHNLLAVMLLSQDRALEALPEVVRALELDPNSEAALRNLRQVVAYLKSKGEAPNLPERVLKLLNASSETVR
ncbi:MAG: hypothetical protein Kow0059_10970 [Candidatus Sumerlaeia bacterium]